MLLAMRSRRILIAILLSGALAAAQTPAAPKKKKAADNKKHVLVIGQTKGFEHDSVPDAMGSIWKMGMDSGLWTTYMRTDTELISKGQVGRNGKNLTYFDLLV